MIIIQTLLIFSLVFIAVYFLTSRKKSLTEAWKKIALVMLVLVAVTAILSPGMMNGAANLVGVGRGADLLLYILTVAFVFTVLNNYLKSKEDQRKIVILARKLALSEAERDNKVR